jgi:hypothetical protein
LDHEPIQATRTFRLAGSRRRPRGTRSPTAPR